MPEVLTESQIASYQESGYLVLEKHLPDEIVMDIRNEILRFEEESRTLSESNERLELEDGHTAINPRIRRIRLPHKISRIIHDLMLSDLILAPARDLIGPNIRLHTTKLNMKSPQNGAAIEWHQDYAFYPHTNDDILAIGVIIDDMRNDNGPLMVYPGSHKGPIYDHHSDEVFVGAFKPTEVGLDSKQAVEITGPAGSISIHHGRIVHGSAQNTSTHSRRILFYEMMAADAFPIMGSLTTWVDIDEYNKLILCGEPTITPRMESIPIRIPQPQPNPGSPISIYEIQKRLRKCD